MSSCSLSGVDALLRVTVALPVSVATLPIGSAGAACAGAGAAAGCGRGCCGRRRCCGRRGCRCRLRLRQSGRAGHRAESGRHILGFDRRRHREDIRGAGQHQAAQKPDREWKPIRCHDRVLGGKGTGGGGRSRTPAAERQMNTDGWPCVPKTPKRRAATTARRLIWNELLPSPGRRTFSAVLELRSEINWLGGPCR